jgi:hypothetical protein
MPRIRIHSHTQALFAGPAPSSGFHFCDSHGSPTGDPDAINLLKQINGVQKVDYNFTASRTEVSELGRREILSRPIVETPSVKLDFDYVTSDLKNEVRMGFNPNFHTGHSYTDAIYEDNTSVFLFSGILSRDLYPGYSGIQIGDGESDYSAWPHAHRDKRNFYLTVAPEGDDAKNITSERHEQTNVCAFGDCYIQQFSTSFAIREPINNKTSWICDYMSYHSSGSGIVPAVTSTGLNYINESNIFVAPKFIGEVSGFFPQSGVSMVARTSDIDFSITSIGYGSDPADIKDIGVDFSSIKAQNVDFTVDFNRRKYLGMGHKIPVDRPISYPIRIAVSLNCLMGEVQAGTLKNFLDNDYTYDLTVDVKAPTIYCTGFEENETIAKYDLLKCNLESVEFLNQVNEARNVNLGFITDVAQMATGRGLFLSGKVFETGASFSGYNF